MPLDSFDNLVLAVQGIADTDDDMSDYVRLAEVQIQLDAKLRMTEEVNAGALVPAQDFITLPADTVHVRHLRINSSPIRGVDIVAPQVFDFFRTSAQGAQVQVAMHQGFKLFLAPTPVSPDPYDLFTDAGIVPLSSSNPTNWLLEQCPNALLYGTLIQWGLGRQGGDERAAGWSQLYGAAIKPLRMREGSTRFGGGPIAMRPDVWA